jgi:hypothetical protein
MCFARSEVPILIARLSIKSWPNRPVDFTQVHGFTMDDHLDYYKRSVEAAIKMEPLIINVQSGWCVARLQ